jgi:uncharacterized repeat protein (TIGR02543 family)
MPSVAWPASTTPARTFNGWYSEATGGTQYTSTGAVNQNLTLYAHWSGSTSYTVTFMTNGGVWLDAEGAEAGDDEKTITVARGTSIGSQMPIVAWPASSEPEKHFAGWWTEQETGGIQYTNASPMVNSVLTLFARWSDTKPFVYGDWEVVGETLSATYPRPDVTKGSGDYQGNTPAAPDNLSADGWITVERNVALSYLFPTSPANASNYDTMTVEFEVGELTGSGTVAEIAVKLYKGYTSYNPYDGTNAEQYIDLKEKTSLSFRVEDFSSGNDVMATGFTWGYNHYASGLADSFKLRITKITFSKITETVTITFDSNGGSTVANIDHPKGLRFKDSRQPARPTKAGVTFNGWYNQALATEYDNKFRVTEALTMYADWNEGAFIVVTNPVFTGWGGLYLESNTHEFEPKPPNNYNCRITYDFPATVADYTKITVSFTLTRLASDTSSKPMKVTINNRATDDWSGSPSFNEYMESATDGPMTFERNLADFGTNKRLTIEHNENEGGNFTITVTEIKFE